jgi:hypothetical protein
MLLICIQIIIPNITPACTRGSKASWAIKTRQRFHPVVHEENGPKGLPCAGIIEAAAMVDAT